MHKRRFAGFCTLGAKGEVTSFDELSTACYINKKLILARRGRSGFIGAGILAKKFSTELSTGLPGGGAKGHPDAVEFLENLQ